MTENIYDTPLTDTSTEDTDIENENEEISAKRLNEYLKDESIDLKEDGNTGRAGRVDLGAMFENLLESANNIAYKIKDEIPTLQNVEVNEGENEEERLYGSAFNICEKLFGKFGMEVRSEIFDEVKLQVMASSHFKKVLIETGNLETAIKSTTDKFNLPNNFTIKVEFTFSKRDNVEENI